MSSAGRLRARLADVNQRLPLLVKVGLPVLVVSVASAKLLEQATTGEVLSQCADLGNPVGLCSSPDSLDAIGAKVALLATDVTAVMLVALWLVFHTFVLRPTGRLASAAARVADGDLDVRLGVPRRPGVRDELVKVSAEFDHMIESVGAHQAQIRSIIDTAYDAFISLDARGYVVDWSHQATTLFGWERDEAVGRELAELIVPERYRERHRTGLAGAALGAEPRMLGRPVELPARHRNGNEVPIELVVWTTEVDGELRFHSFLRDISERKQLEEQLTHQAFHDALTGLANRRLFQDRLEHALQRRGAGVGVVFCDLDDFKTINDSMGHAAGDRVLLSIAERLRAVVRPSDTLARLAGDEFAVLVEDAAEDEVDAVAHRLLHALRPPVPLDGREVVARASLGLATTATALSQTGGDVSDLASDLLRNADAAMYEAKRRGKDVVERYAPHMHEHAVERLSLRADLHGALARGEMRVEYQPFVDAGTGRITGCEALLRWDHPVRGLVPPTNFIPLAEETGFIRDLGRWVLAEACTQLVSWRSWLDSSQSLTVSVNVSVRQLEEASFVDDVAHILADTGADPESIVLELTESVLSHDQESVLHRLHQLKSLGVGIAVDDFGTGYSSLALLRHLPVDVIKIDRSFIVPLQEGVEADSSVVAAILQIGASRGLRMVAEGVETDEQLDALRRLGCEVYQGFIFHRPMRPENLAARLADESGQRLLLPEQQSRREPVTDPL